MNPMQQQPNPMLPNMGAMGMLPPGFNNPFLAMNLKPEELAAMAASFGGMKGMMPPMQNPMAALNATTSQSHHNNNNNHHNSSSAGLPTTNTVNSSRAASTSRPHSTTPASKRAKIELEETDGELEIDVQNDDTATSSARPSSTSHANGNSHKNLKSGRESAQSLSSRDSSSTPKLNKTLNPNAAMAAAMVKFKALQEFSCVVTGIF
jgi:hypothetical protein